MNNELNPCPKCGRGVTGRLFGGTAAYGCREWDYEVECECGLMWDFSPGDVDEEEAVRQGAEAWNERVERTCKPNIFMDEQIAESIQRWLGECECGAILGEGTDCFRVSLCFPNYCPNCGAKIEGGRK